jgi:hypothetical protein
MDSRFTTRQYQQAAAKLALQEANQVAKQLRLPEDLPITETNATGIGITPFGFNYIHKGIGSISTKHYVYYITQDYKFNQLDVADYDATCLKLEKQPVPIQQMDTNAAYQLAVQWLAALSMDVKGLNRDCYVEIKTDQFWNRVNRHSKSFVPIYDVSWLSPEQRATRYGDTAFVQLFAPTKELLQLCVRNPAYILRKPVTFTNFDSLFPGVGRVRVYTNHPPVNLPPPPP